MKRFFVFVIAIFFLSSCSFTQSTQKQSSQPIKKTIQEKPQTPKKRKKREKAVSGMLRGVIISQTFDEQRKLWLYGLKVIDIANDSLKEVEFFYKNRVLDAGDLVYVLFGGKNADTAKDIFLIKKEYRKIKKHKKLSSPSKKLKKRTKARQTPWIGLPKTNTIKLK